MKKILGLLLLLFLGAVLWKLASSGAFRTIENRFNGTIAKKIQLSGAEDFAMDYTTGLLFISATDRANSSSTRNPQNGLYLMNLNNIEASPQFLTKNLAFDFNPHGISLFKIDTAHYKIYAINHVKDSDKTVHSIELFTYQEGQLIHNKTFKDDLIFSPNDILAVSENSFYFTNDHGGETKRSRAIEEYLALPKSSVVYFDGRTFRKAAGNIAYANGINRDAARGLLFVASPPKFLTKVYKVQPDGMLEFIEDIPCGTGVDNLELDENGNLWSGAHPNLLAFASYSAKKKPFAPSEIIKIVYRNRGDYEVQSVYENDGTDMSASSVAVPYKNLIAIGNVADDHFLILRSTN